MSDTKLVGIINITPDSFSDGGIAFSATNSINLAKKLISEGADILDIGAESTRPNAITIDAEQEISRLEPALKEIIDIAMDCNVEVSLDTRHAKTAEFGLKAGVHWINDVSGGVDENLLKLVAEIKADTKYVLMHSLTIPPQAHISLKNDATLLPNIISFFEQKINYLQNSGIKKHNIIIDAGLGFGKDMAANINLMLASQHIQQQIGCDLMVGHSRKSMFKIFKAENIAERNQLTLLSSAFLMQQKIAYLRVHDVAAHKALFNNLKNL